MRVPLTAIVTFVAFSFAHAQPVAVPRDQAQGTVRTVLTALSNGNGLECTLRGEQANGTRVPLEKVVGFASTVVTLNSSLPTYEFVLPAGSLGQTAVIVTLSKDSKSLSSAVMISSQAVDVMTMTGEITTQLIPVSMSDCK